MEQFVQLVMQSGALGLLAYLIWWVTRTGAPQLFTCLIGIKGSLDSVTSRLENVEDGQKGTHNRLDKVEDDLKELRREVEAHRGT